jgi:hypothetical protein
MVDPMDDIVRQARQGSVSAIIQVLNEKLAGSGIRTRAMFAQGVLQLLCEGAKPDQLEQPIIVPQVRQILESLQPRHIRKANINCRVVREQQLLWLEEISRDPENQLLWSEEITLRQPGFFQRLTQDAKDRRQGASRTDLSKSAPKRLAREKKVFWRGLVGGASLSLFLLLLGWATYGWLSPKLAGLTSVLKSAAPETATPETATPETATPETAASTQPKPASPVPPSASNSAGASAGSQRPASQPAAPKADHFAEAVRLAQDTVIDGQAAQTSAEWLEVATRWQQASDLMSQIPASDSRYPIAQDRVDQYRQNSETALQKAQSQ